MMHTPAHKVTILVPPEPDDHDTICIVDTKTGRCTVPHYQRQMDFFEDPPMTEETK